MEHPSFCLRSPENLAITQEIRAAWRREREAAIDRVLVAVDSLRAEQAQGGPLHKARLQKRRRDLELAITAAAGCLKPRVVLRTDIEARKRANALDWNIDPRHRRKERQ
jgi:hypothetical protein